MTSAVAAMRPLTDQNPHELRHATSIQRDHNISLRSSKLGNSADDVASTNGHDHDTSKAMSISQGVYRAMQAKADPLLRGRSSHHAVHHHHGPHPKLISHRSSFIQMSNETISSEVTTEAEAKFSMLMEYIASVSREASSFRESWGRVTADRTSWTTERDEFIQRMEELTIELGRREECEADLRRETTVHEVEIERLVAELAVLARSSSDQKLVLVEREQELEHCRHRQKELQFLLTRTKTEHARIVGEVEVLQSELSALATERLTYREDLESKQLRIDVLLREQTELRHRSEELTEKLEVCRQESEVSNSRYRELQLERDRSFAESEQVSEQLRRAIRKTEELAASLAEAVEHRSRLQKECHQLKEALRKSEEERATSLATIETLQIENKAKTSSLEDLETQCRTLTLSLGQSKREVATRDERIFELEAELARLRVRVETRDEEYRLLNVEQDTLREERDSIRSELHKVSRKIVELEALSVAREAACSAARAELAKSVESVALAKMARDELQERYNKVSAECALFKTEVESLRIELLALTSARDHHRGEAHEYEDQICELTETIARFEEETTQLEIELKSMRSVLREVREQKERAIAARESADRERDKAISQYEQKCREVEIFEDNRSASLLSMTRRSESRATITRGRITSGESRSMIGRIASGSMRSEMSAS